ncbi:MAG TPA: hypothetical protein VMP01_29880 [Pirellulaceae bacterium]|nr:hypothetical protein [Pirellulaceae bacterium]
MSDDEPLLCTRCLKMVPLGRGEFYVVQIDAVADPTPPELTRDASPRDLKHEWRELVAELADLSPQEALDQVHRRVIIHLCTACYNEWIENPAGG